MTLGDEELRSQLGRRVGSAPLSQVDRVELTERIHTERAGTRISADPRLSRWLIPAAALLTVVALVAVATFPRPAVAPGQSSSPGPTPNTTPTLGAPGGLTILSGQELMTLTSDPAAIGRVVLTRALLTACDGRVECPGPTLSPLPAGAVVDILRADPSTELTPIRAVRIIGEPGKVEVIGPVALNADETAWSVAGLLANPDIETTIGLWAVNGWLMQTVPAPCAAPPDMSAPQDYWCGGSWITAQPVSTTNGNSVQLTIPGAMHVQWDAYREFALDPQVGANGGEPRFGTYLVRLAGCPPNVMGDCPVWEMVGRLDPTTVAVPMSPTPDPMPTQQPEVDCLDGMEVATCENALLVALAAVRSSGWSPVHIWISGGQLCPREDCLFDPTANFPYPVPRDGGQAIGRAEIAFAETDKHAGLQLASIGGQLEAVLIGYAVPSRNWCSGNCPTSSMTDGPFRLDLVMRRLDWRAADSISGTAILSFAGDGPTDISGSGHPIGFSYVEVNGDRSVYPVFSADCATHRLDPATPMTQLLSKSGVLETDFQRSFVPGPDIKLPVGTWDITAIAGFFDGPACSPATPYDMKATLRISVTQ